MPAKIANTDPPISNLLDLLGLMSCVPSELESVEDDDEEAETLGDAVGVALLVVESSVVDSDDEDEETPP